MGKARKVRWRSTNIPKNVERWRGRYESFTPARYSRLFEWSKRRFLRGINENAKILEVGSGSGRLADFILRNSKCRPENYFMMDLAYKEKVPFLKSKIFKLIKEKKIGVLAQDLFNPKLKGKFDKIIIAESFFVPERFFKKELRKSNLSGVHQEESDAFGLLKVIDLYLPLLNPKGELFLSNCLPPDLKFVGESLYQRKLLLKLYELKKKGIIQWEFPKHTFYLKKLK